MRSLDQLKILNSLTLLGDDFPVLVLAVNKRADKDWVVVAKVVRSQLSNKCYAGELVFSIPDTESGRKKAAAFYKDFVENLTKQVA